MEFFSQNRTVRFLVLLLPFCCENRGSVCDMCLGTRVCVYSGREEMMESFLLAHHHPFPSCVFLVWFCP